MNDLDTTTPSAPTDAPLPLDPAPATGATPVAPSRLRIADLDARTIFIPPGSNRWRDNPDDRKLRKSLETLGMFHPVAVVMVAAGLYKLVSGSRRLGAWLTSEILRDRPIPAVIVPDDRALTGAMDENLRREQLDPVDRARFIKQAIENSLNPAETIDLLVEHLDITADHVRNVRRVLERPQLWHEVEARRIPLMSAVTLAGLSEDGLAEFLAQSLGNNPSLSRNRVAQLANERVGTELRASIRRTGLRESIGAAVERLVSLGTDVLELDVEFDVKATKSTVVVRVPMPQRGVNAAHGALADVQAIVAARAAQLESEAGRPKPDVTTVEEPSPAVEPPASATVPVAPDTTPNG